MSDNLSKKTEKKDIKGRIANALTELIEEKNFLKITVRDICKKSSLSRQSFYRTFYDKYDVFSYIFKSYIDEAMNSYGLLAMSEIATIGLSFFCEHKKAIKEMGCDFGYPNPFMISWFEVCFEHYFRILGKSRITPELEFAMKFYFHATYFSFYECVCGNIPGDIEETIAIVLSLQPDNLKKALYEKEK